MEQNGSKMTSKTRQGVPLRPWKTRSRKKTPAAGKNNATFDTIADLGWFWPLFWTPGGPVGVPKSSLFHKICAWGAKKPVLGAFQEKKQNIMDFWNQNDRLLRGKTMLKRCTVVKKQGFGGSRKVRFLGPKFDFEKHEISHKICPWGALGSIFLIFWGFGTGRFFDGFRDRKKWVQNP